MDLTNLFNLIKQDKSKSILFIGLGNKDRGDDLAGIYIINKLQKNFIPNQQKRDIKFLVAGRVPENYLQKIIDLQPEIIIFIDTAYMNEEPGIIKVIPPESIDTLCTSTHTSSLSLIISYIKNSIDTDVYLIGIQPESTQYWKDISYVITKSCNLLIDELLNIL